MSKANALSSRWRRELAFPLSAATVILTDQLTKLLAKSILESKPPPPDHYFFRWTYVENQGSAFGLLTNAHFLIAFTALMAIATIVIYYRFPYWNHPLLKIGLGLMLGGAIGNLIDRLRLGYVVDFIDFRVWPVFNIADSAISVGVITLAFYFIFIFKDESKSE
jgi:signal peptidase II